MTKEERMAQARSTPIKKLYASYEANKLPAGYEDLTIGDLMDRIDAGDEREIDEMAKAFRTDKSFRGSTRVSNKIKEASGLPYRDWADSKYATATGRINRLHDIDNIVSRYLDYQESLGSTYDDDGANDERYAADIQLGLNTSRNARKLSSPLQAAQDDLYADILASIKKSKVDRKRNADWLKAVKDYDKKY